MQGEPVPEVVAQARRQIAVNFYRVQVSGRGDQRARQRAESGSDFNKMFAVRRVNCGDDGSDDGTVVQKILAEPAVRESLSTAGVEPYPGNATDLSRLISADLVKYAQLAKSANIKAE